MAINANVVSQQSMEFNVLPVGNGSPNRVVITSGIAQFGVSASGQPNQRTTQNLSVKLLVNPAFAPGQFRKAVGVVGLGSIGYDDWTPGDPITARWSIDDVATSLDDESGMVELRVDLSVTTLGASTYTASVTFQVTALATT